MKIAVNARLLRKNDMDGIGWFSYNVLKFIVEQNPSIEFHFLFDSKIDNDFLFGKNIVAHKLFPPSKHAILNVIWFEWSLKNTLNKIKPDLFLSPDGFPCLGWKGKQYGVIHDINYYHNPQDLKWSNRTYYNYFFPKFADIACRIGTVSNFSKQDIIEHYNIDSNKIDVVYNGVNSFFTPLTATQKQAFKASFTGGEDYFVFVGSLHPRKNLIRLLEAFDLFKTTIQSNIKLVISGKGLYKVEEIYAKHQQLKFKEYVIFTGRVDDDQLNNILGAALALTFVPVFEGFGIPIIEAMQSEVPVICSNVTSMPEVAGDAALLVDLFDVNAIAAAMQSIYSNETLRLDLIEKGRRQKELFSWKKTADLVRLGVTKCL